MKNYIKRYLPTYIIYSLSCVVLLLAFFEGYKWLFYTFFSDSFAVATPSEIEKAWNISLRFDIRAAIMLSLPVIIPAMIVPNAFFQKRWGKRYSSIYFTVLGAVMILSMMSDAGCFSYTGLRLNSSLLEFMKNPLISLQMLYQTYPIWWAVIALVAAVVVIRWVFRGVYRMCSRAVKYTLAENIAWRVVSVLLIAWGIYGSVSHYPLRWSEAYFSKDKNVQALSLNPILFFFSSFSSADTEVDMEAFEKYLPAVCRYLGTEADNPFERHVEGCDSPRRNVVIVLLESFGAAPMSAFDCPMPSTPRTDSLLKKSLFFSNAYVPRWGTAYTVYGSVTGIPDVTQGTTASRVPAAVDQRVILDCAKDYKRYYLLGGSANWANIRAIFQSNIADINIYEEGSYTTEDRVDVWGIDDYDLFEYSSQIFDSLNRRGENFIAYVQTSSNHRPYTVPDSREDWRPLREDEVDMKTLSDAGFLELAQYNALRYLDFNIERFIRRAHEEGWADNTLIVFFGDHNMSMNPYKHSYPEYQADLTLYHIPVFMYAPWLQAKKIDAPFNLMDVIPTAFSVAGIPYTNHTLGRDMSDSTYHKGSHAFICQPYNGIDGLTIVGDSTVYRRNIDTPAQASAFRYKKGEDIKVETEDMERFSAEDSLALGIYHAARYLYFNNKK